MTLSSASNSLRAPRPRVDTLEWALSRFYFFLDPPYFLCNNTPLNPPASLPWPQAVAALHHDFHNHYEWTSRPNCPRNISRVQNCRAIPLYYSECATNHFIITRIPAIRFLNHYGETSSANNHFIITRIPSFGFFNHYGDL